MHRIDPFDITQTGRTTQLKSITLATPIERYTLLMQTMESYQKHTKRIKQKDAHNSIIK